MAFLFDKMILVFKESVKTVLIAVSILVVIQAILYVPQKLFKKEPVLKEPTLSEVKIPILVYHYVEYNQDERDFLRDSLNIQPHIFEQQIVTLKDAGYKFITTKEIPLLFIGDKQNAKYVILSFDDGYHDFYTDVFPLLKKHNVKAVNYLIYNSIGRLNYMKKEQIEEIVGSGLVEFGSHTLSHAWLTSLDKINLDNEVHLSKKNIESEFDVIVNSFAYPYGEYNNLVIDSVKKAGYTNAVTDTKGNIIFKDKLFEIQRIRPGYNIGQDLLNLII